MADAEEKKRPTKPASGDKSKAKASKVKTAEDAAETPAAEVLSPVSGSRTAAPDEAAVAAPAAAEPAAKLAKKPAKAKKEEAPAVEAPKENLSLNPDDVEKPK